jgi:hypothetical protein
MLRRRRQNNYNPETESEAFDEMQDLTMKPK